MTAVIDSRRLNWFILASVPAVILGLWSVGTHTLGASAGLEGEADWPLRLIRDLGADPSQPQFLHAVLLGACYFLPRLAAAALVSLAWAGMFARLRHRALDLGWFHAAWLFTLLLPAGLPLPLLVIGLSFGLVFGCHVFGGTGRYIVNPALLGVVFLTIAYPQSMDSHWVPGHVLPATWTVAATQGQAALAAAGTGWLDLVIGREVAAIGSPAAGACLAGALLLILMGLTSWRIPAGALAALLLAGVGFESVSWQWQPVLGTFAFALAFIATDPSTMPASRHGRWALGLVFGVLTIVIRMLNPEHPEGTLFALLLATLVTPLVDHWAARGRAGVDLGRA